MAMRRDELDVIMRRKRREVVMRRSGRRGKLICATVVLWMFHVLAHDVVFWTRHARSGIVQVAGRHWVAKADEFA